MTLENCFTTNDRVYLSGPISEIPDVLTSVNDHLMAFSRTYLTLMNMYGTLIQVLNPACINQELDYDEMMRRDYAMLNGCSHILMLPNWQYSKGACSELLVANQMKIKARYLIGDYQTVAKNLIDCVAVKRTMMETIEATITCL